MSDYKNRDDVIAEIKRFKGYLDDDMITRLVIAIDRIPSADVVEVRHGHWIEKNTNKDGTHNIYCNECGKYIKSKGHANSWYVRHALLYCPYCGAKMDGKEQEHE